MIDPAQIKRNSWTENLGSDFVAVDAQGNVLARAGDRESAEKAAPDNAGIFGAKDLEPQARQPKQASPEPAKVEEPAPIAAADPEPETPAPVADGSAFDNDSDGRVGGGRKRKPKAES